VCRLHYRNDDDDAVVVVWAAAQFDWEQSRPFDWYRLDKRRDHSGDSDDVD
jgi:hypothetical protein